MPAVLSALGLRAVIYPNDHRPAHVHVMGNGCEAVFESHCLDGPPELRVNYCFTRKQRGLIAAWLIDNLAQSCAKWRYIHGNFT